MVNSTGVTHFLIGAYMYMHTGSIKYLYLMIIALVYMIIVFANTTLIVTICVNRSLHEPMYLFLCSLFVNELYGSTGLFPFLLAQHHIVSDTHTVSKSLCFLHLYCVSTYGHVEICNLAVMSYDRYLAICRPLQYNVRMTTKNVAVLIAVAWVYPLLIFLIVGILIMPQCGNGIIKLYSQNFQIFTQAYHELIITVLIISVPLIQIIISYITILKICIQGSKDIRQKAVRTCTPQLVSLLSFSFGCLFEIIKSRLDITNIPLHIFLSLYFLLCQPLFSPIMYGLRISKIRKILWHFLQSRLLVHVS